MKIQNVGLLCVAVTALVGCGGGSGENSTVLTGIFLDSPVEGISYNTDTLSGNTNSQGEFRYIEGETITFSIGDLAFPPIKAASVVTPVDMSASDTIDDNVTLNVATLLQSLDIDANPENGIEVPESAKVIASVLDFNLDPSQFAQQPNLINLVANSGSVNVQLIDPSMAREHLQASIDNFGFDKPVGYMDGLWRQTNWVEPPSMTPENPSGDPQRSNTYILVQNGGVNVAVYIEYLDFYGIDGKLYVPACGTVATGTVADDGRLLGQLGIRSDDWVGANSVLYEYAGESELRLVVDQFNGNLDTLVLSRVGGPEAVIDDSFRSVPDCSVYD